MPSQDELKISEPKFDNHRILLLYDSINIYVGMRSVIEGMGLIWYRQKQKIREERRVQRLNFRCKGRRYNTIFLHKNFVQEFLNQIDLIRIPHQKRQKVIFYQTEFINFIDNHLLLNNKSVYDSYLDSGILGIKKLLNDIYAMRYQKGYESIAKILYHLMLDSNLSTDQLLLTSEIYEIADYLSKNQFRLKS